MIPKPYLLFLGEAKDELAIKTAAGVNFWRPEWCIGQLRFPKANAQLEIPEMTIREAVQKGAKTFVIGVVNAGGIMPDSWREVILEAINSGMDIASGMHSKLSSFREFEDAAKKNNVQLHDLRFSEKKFDTGKGIKRKGKRLLTVGTDCSVGKKYTALAVEKALIKCGIDASFKATGQTGVLIAENGIAIDAIVSDFISGAVEWLSPNNDENHWDVIEGQGSLLHPSFAGVSLGLLHGSQPDAFLVCHEPTRIKMRGVETPIPSINEIIHLTISLGSLTNKKIKCIGVALNTSEMNEDPKILKEKISNEFGLPCLDPIVDNLEPFVNLIKKI